MPSNPKSNSQSVGASVSRSVRERKLSERKLLKIADGERRRIGQELHDVMGQELAGLAFMSEALLVTLREAHVPELKLAVTLKSTIKRILGLVRTEAWGLIPIEIEAREFVTALSGLATQISERFGVKCELFCEAPIAVQKSVTATNLYRIAQEAITNAIKHGFASHVHVILSGNERQILLRIQDDGLGLQNQSSRSGGQGLQIMRFRAGLINATLDVEPLDTGGVRVTCAVKRKGQ